MRMQFPLAPTVAALILAAMTLSLPTHGEEAHRELGAHVHGHGTLNMAIEEKRVSMELEVPGMDIVGFEHAASTKEQKAAVEKATAQLAKPLDVFALPPQAGCTVAEASVAVEGEQHDDDHDHAAADKDDAKAEHDHEEASGHNQFHATYALDCTQPTELTAITFDYFKLFAGAHELTVNVVTAKGQNKYEVSRDKPTLDLGGIM